MSSSKVQSGPRRPLSRVQLTAVIGSPSSASSSPLIKTKQASEMVIKKEILTNKKNSKVFNKTDENDGKDSFMEVKGKRVSSKKTSKKSVLVKNFESVEVQTEDENVALVTGEEAPLKYWKDLAETRREALDTALEENYSLRERLEELEKENKLLEEMVEEAKTLAGMLQDLQDEEDDDLDESGIEFTGRTAQNDSVLEKDSSD